MAKTKKNAVQLVQLYERKTKTGTTYYLHYSINGEQFRENTHLRLTGDKEADKVTTRAALMMQADKTAALLSDRTGIATQTKKNSILFVEYCEKLANRYNQAKTRTSEYTKKMQLLKVAKFAMETDAKIKLCNVNKSFCESFVRTINRHGDITETTKAHIFGRFVFVLNCAVKEELITANPAEHVAERPQIKQIERVYLTESELKAFADVETVKPHEAETKRAFLFSCLTGLRFSDVCRLTAENIEDINGALRLKIETKKTKKYISFILSPECSALIREQLETCGTNSLLFPLPDPTYLNRILKGLAMSANIDNPLTFHTARHTFATLLLTKGADLYTVSTLLGHSDIQTTQIYAKIVDKKKDDTINLLSGIL